MSLSIAINFVLTFVIIFSCYYFANKIVKSSHQREKIINGKGSDVEITILSMEQSGLFLNNNPVIEMNLRITDDNRKALLVEKHKETVLLISLDKYQVGNSYKGKYDINNDKFVFERSGSGMPIKIVH